MDYEKEYKSLVAKVKKAHQFAQTNSTKNVLEDILPQLRESEDERIRRRMVEHFKSKTKETWCNIPVKDILKWLEKQKEQRPDIELIQRTWYMEGYQDREHNLEPEWIIKTGEGGPKYELNPKSGQQLAEEDDPLNDERFCKGFVTGRKVQEIFDEQKPAEWSEEDDLMQTAVIQTLERFGGRGTTGMQIDWLKSLRPQPHWKPSEEQIEALKDVAYGTYQNGDGPALRELYEQLKKL